MIISVQLAPRNLRAQRPDALRPSFQRFDKAWKLLDRVNIRTGERSYSPPEFQVTIDSSLRQLMVQPGLKLLALPIEIGQQYCFSAAVQPFQKVVSLLAPGFQAVYIPVYPEPSQRCLVSPPLDNDWDSRVRLPSQLFEQSFRLLYLPRVIFRARVSEFCGISPPGTRHQDLFQLAPSRCISSRGSGCFLKYRLTPCSLSDSIRAMLDFKSWGWIFPDT